MVIRSHLTRSDFVLKRVLKFRVENITRGTLIGADITSAETSSERRIGLLKHSKLEEGAGLWIVPCESIHTFFMKFAIDVIYIDRKRRVRSAVRTVAPWRFSMCLSAHSVLELPPGTIDRTDTRKGDQLVLESHAAPQNQTLEH
jgi:uncharacterized membrane protein (UPF0127 family)